MGEIIIIERKKPLPFMLPVVPHYYRGMKKADYLKHLREGRAEIQRYFKRWSMSIEWYIGANKHLLSTLS